MTYTVHSETFNGYRIDIHQDEDRDPRDGDGYGLFVMFKQAGWVGADDYIDQHGRWSCWNCDGEGPACPVCYGEGEMVADTTDEWIKALSYAFHGRWTMPVVREEHGGNSTYKILHDWGTNWDARIVGFVIYTQEHLSMWGIEPDTPYATLTEHMVSEMDEFTDWANGNVWGYTVTGPDGEITGSCYGFIGEPDGEVLDEARALARFLPTATPLYTVKLEAAEIALLYYWACESKSILAESSLDKLRNALVAVEKGEQSDI